MKRFLPFLDLKDTSAEDVRMDLQAALAVTFMSVPQGVAYAVIAGLPPAMGLYAGALPAIVGSLFRSSRHVVSGPTNAISLLVGTAVAAQATDPVAAAATLALMVGAFQLLAGVLSLGAIVDYISTAVVLGYITGAGVLIGVGQLGNATATERVRGNLVEQIGGWVAGLGETDPRAVAIAAATALGMVVLRRIVPGFPVAIAAMAVGIALSWGLDLGGAGLPLVRDLTPIPQGLPPFTVPGVDTVWTLLPIAVAATVLSLIESSAVARAIAARTGQTLDVSVDFAGQGLSNLSAAFFGGYPVSGSLSRSALNHSAGARTRLGGAMSGAMLLGILMFLGPLVDLTPVASLAGVLLVIAVDLVDFPQIRRVLQSGWGDRLAFAGTVIGTWTLSLDQAIYLGVGISLVLFLRRARLLTVRQLGIDGGRLRERTASDPLEFGLIPELRVLHVEGSLFFGAANELRDSLERHLVDPRVRALVVRLKRAHDLDYTTASVLESVHDRMADEGRELFLVGMRPAMMRDLERTGVAEVLGEDHLFPTRPTWFAAMNCAIEAAAGSVEAQGGDATAVHAYLDRQRLTARGSSSSATGSTGRSPAARPPAPSDRRTA